MDAGVPVVVNQVQFSLLDRRPLNGMVQLAKERGVKVSGECDTTGGGWFIVYIPGCTCTVWHI
jgi:hypothetical protein